MRELEREEEERQRRPVRFGEANRNPAFSEDFANQGLRSLEDNSPNLNNRGRFDPSRPRGDPLSIGNDREPRQEGEFCCLLVFPRLLWSDLFQLARQLTVSILTGQLRDARTRGLRRRRGPSVTPCRTLSARPWTRWATGARLCPSAGASSLVTVSCQSS